MIRWADRHLGPEDDLVVVDLIRRSCGPAAEPYLACAHCHGPLTARDIEARVR